MTIVTEDTYRELRFSNEAREALAMAGIDSHAVAYDDDLRVDPIVVKILRDLGDKALEDGCSISFLAWPNNVPFRVVFQDFGGESVVVDQKKVTSNLLEMLESGNTTAAIQLLRTIRDM